jgi:hypothetical protein
MHGRRNSSRSLFYSPPHLGSDIIRYPIGRGGSRSEEKGVMNEAVNMLQMFGIAYVGIGKNSLLSD